MSAFVFESVELFNYRCFTSLNLRLEPDLTVLFAENGGGKTTLLNALATGIALFQPRSPKELKLDALRDVRKVLVGNGPQSEPAGPCKVTWQSKVAMVGERSVNWSVAVNPASKTRRVDVGRINDAIECIRDPGTRWPLFAWYGTDRMRRGKRPGRPNLASHDRWDGYAASLVPLVTDGPLLDWMEREILGDFMRHKKGEPERKFDKGVADAMVHATPGIVDAWYDPVERSPVVRFEDGHIAPWSELSDGYYTFLVLVGDIARRAVMLNERDGAEAPQLVEGVVLIDEIDLHLHPRWQRVALKGLRKAFPKLQFVVTTHSPQVLSSVEDNRQVRHLVNWQLQEDGVYVDGRDTNSILRDYMDTDDRDEEGKKALRELHAAIDGGRPEEAKRLYEILVARWGETDTALIRARKFMEL